MTEKEIEPNNKKRRSSELKNSSIFKDPILIKDDKEEIYEKNKKYKQLSIKEVNNYNIIEEEINSDYLSYKIAGESCDKFGLDNLEIVNINETGEINIPIYEKEFEKLTISSSISVYDTKEINLSNDLKNNLLINNKSNIKDNEILINMEDNKKEQLEKENPPFVNPNLPFYTTYLKEPVFHEEEKEDGTSLFIKKDKKISKRKKKILAFSLLGLLALLCIGIVLITIIIKRRK